MSQHSTESSPNEMRNRRSASYGTPLMTGAFPESDRGHTPSSTIGSPVAGRPSAEPSLAPLWGMHSPHRKGVIKADPAMTTTFDPSDAELYTLWAPAR
ncbi:hypothetical protein JB92DRAFT_2904556 [Gautieria morchelliformis]|nr:hypothetical protein JB92DRAFT_2904556 [Gautieria morchelliformis]